VKRLRGFGQFWWDFVVGDDWLSAAAVVAAIALTALLAHASVSSWWLMPVAVIGVLYRSLRRATRG
jgi:hypothetical protein